MIRPKDNIPGKREHREWEELNQDNERENNMKNINRVSGRKMG
jgi:hypothetical protein